ncbi:hypothetical protein GCM10017581_010610 [Dactylosporangium matsuzakiense]|uniref:Uncharacterized protein n=1 Tax=Dactylosporangium matsuzakiense TaxID=53360 RepID=A0A9W6NJR1_9ACTN|nr:hypothetical protein GCM10017581_010610 [Dactylosporangium matsuzakiense]
MWSIADRPVDIPDPGIIAQRSLCGCRGRHLGTRISAKATRSTVADLHGRPAGTPLPNRRSPRIGHIRPANNAPAAVRIRLHLEHAGVPLRDCDEPGSFSDQPALRSRYEASWSGALSRLRDLAEADDLSERD